VLVDGKDAEFAKSKEMLKEADKEKSAGQAAQDFKDSIRDVKPMDLDDKDKQNPAVKAALARGEHVMKFRNYEEVADYFGNNAAKSDEGAAKLYNMMETNRGNAKVEPLLEQELKKQIEHASTPEEKERLGLIAAKYSADNGQNISSPELKKFFEEQEAKFGEKKKDGSLAAPEGFTQWSKDGNVPDFVKNLTKYLDGKVDEVTSHNLKPDHVVAVNQGPPQKGVGG
jgi:hypothetical protein